MRTPLEKGCKVEEGIMLYILFDDVGITLQSIMRIIVIPMFNLHLQSIEAKEDTRDILG